MAPRQAPDEDSVRSRPNPRGSRPRTKDRPRHVDAVPAQVLTVDRGRYGCLLGTFEAPEADDVVITAMKARELGKASIVVGDRVELVGDVSGAEGSLARVVRVADRTSVLRRTADDTDPVERIVVANADQLAVVTALADPEPRFRLLDRALAAAFDAHIAPLLVLTKADLADPAPVAGHYAALDVPYVASECSGDGTLAPQALDALRERLAGRVTVFLGHSGVGKSTLVNALVPGADRATGHVNDVTGRGRHTSSSVVALRLPGGGWVVDTPGVRSFGLAHLDPQRLIEAFPDLAAGTDGCPRGCTHDEPECALDTWVTEGHAGPAGPARLDSLRRLLRSRDGRADDEADHQIPRGT